MLVTVGTDGAVDYLEMPSGERYSLGVVSVVDLLNRTVVHTKDLERALSAFQNNGSCLVKMDDPLGALDYIVSRSMSYRMFLSSANLLLKGDRIMMDRSLKVKFAALEMAASLVKKAAASGNSVPLTLLAQLKVASQEFCEACESGAATTAQQQEPQQQETQEQAPTQQASVPGGSTAGDLAMATETLSLINRTAAKIDAAVASGRKFNAAKARQDLFKLASSIAEFSSGENPSVNVAETHKEASRIAKLFLVGLSPYPLAYLEELPAMPSANKPESTYIYKQGTTPNTHTVVSQKNKIFSYVVGKNQFQQLGVVSEFGIDESRGVDKVRGIGMGDQIAELVPSVTETSLTVTATLLYALNLFQMMGYKAGVDGLVRSLKHHRWPFDIKQEMVFSYLSSNETANADGLGVSGFKAASNPAPGAGAFLDIEPNIKALFTFFEGCWFNSYGTSFSADAGVVTNNCGIDVSDVVDGTSFYGEYIDSGLTPGANGNTTGNGSSIRFGPNGNSSNQTL